MTPLRQRMIDDMSVRGLSENTKKSYLSAMTGLTRHYRRGPDRIEVRQVQDYLLYLHNSRGLSWKSCNTIRHGLRFFYRITLGLPDPHLYVPDAKQPSRLPEILNHDELVRLFTVTTNPKHRALLMTAYAAGLRASELGRLRVSDIDSGRMALRVEQGKGSIHAQLFAVAVRNRAVCRVLAVMRPVRPYPVERAASQENRVRLHLVVDATVADVDLVAEDQGVGARAPTVVSFAILKTS